MKIISTLLIFFFNISFYGQKSIKDTVIDSVTYHYADYRKDRTLKALHQNKKKEQGGHWIYFDENNKIESEGEYNKNGEKEGEWYYFKENAMWFIEYKNGKKTGKTGHGQRGSGF